MSSFSWSLIIDHSVGKDGELGVWRLCLLPLCVDTLTLLVVKGVFMEWLVGVVTTRDLLWSGLWMRSMGVWVSLGIRPVSGGPAVLCVTLGWRC